MKKKLLIGYFAQITNFGSNLIVLLFLIYFLSQKEIGLWYLLSSILALTLIVESGVQPTLSRSISQIKSGSTEVLGLGLSKKKLIDGYDTTYLRKFINQARLLYIFLCLIVCMLILVIGTSYLYAINELNKSTVIFLLLLTLVTVFNLYYTYMSPILIGYGNQTAVNISLIYSKCTYVFITFILLLLDYGLISVVFGLAFSSIIFRLKIKKYFQMSFLKEYKKSEGLDKKIIMNILKTSNMMSLSQFGTFLVLKVSVLVSGFYFSLEEVSRYALSVQLLTTANHFSSYYTVYMMPKINSMVLKSLSIKKEILSSLTISSLTYFLLIFIVFIIFEPIIKEYKNKDMLLQSSVFLLLTITYYLELIHSQAGIILTSLNKVPFLKSSLVSGFSILIVSVFGIHYYNFPIEFLVITQFFIQIFYNNWYWPLKIYNTFFK